MKKKIWLMVVCGTLVLGGSLTALAAPWGRGGAEVKKPGRGNGPCRVEARQGHWEQMAARLDLSAEQQAEVRKLCDANRAEAEKLHARLTEVRRELRQAMAPNRFDEKTLRKLAAEKNLLQTDLMVNRARTHSRIHALLTPEQQELADLARKMKQLRGRQTECGRPGKGGSGEWRSECPRRMN